MSLYPELETIGYVFLANDSNSTKITVYDDDFANDDADFQISIVIIQLGMEEQVFFEQELATHKANVGGTNANLLVKGCIIKTSDGRFKVTNKPKPLKLFDGKYSIRLQQTNA